MKNTDNALLPQSQLTPMGLRIRRWREHHDMTHQQLADRLKVSPSTLKNYLSGATSPTLDTAILMADMMEIPLDDLVGRDGYSLSDQKLHAAEQQIADLQRESVALHEALAASHARIKDKDAHIASCERTISAQVKSIRRSSIFMIFLCATLFVSLIFMVLVKGGVL